jgi:alkylhydroperoxidase family enzyme
MPRLDAPRVAPVSIETASEETRELLARFARSDGRGEGGQLNIFRTLAHHPDLLKRWTVFGNHVLFKSTLPARDREIAILRVGWLCRSEYEWGQHVVIGKREGLTDDEIRRIAAGADASGWDPFESALVRATDELHDDAMIGAETWAALSERYSTEQLMDLVFTVGQYHLVSMALNTLGVQLDAGVEGFEATAGRLPEAPE